MSLEADYYGHCLLDEAVLSNTFDDLILHRNPPYHTCMSKTYFEDSEKVSNQVIHLEDLHKNTKKVMQKLSDEMGIPFNESMLKSTFGGLKWTNRPTSMQVSGPSTAIIQQRHKDIISMFDRIRLYILMTRHRKFMAYPANNYLLFLPLTLILLPFLFWPMRIEKLARQQRKNGTWKIPDV